MDRRIRVLGLVFVLCFALLFLALNNLQVVQAPGLLATSTAQADQTPKNPFSEPRGDIVSADGVIVAESTPSNDSVGEQRSYPEARLFADVTGYYDAVDVAATGVEGFYDHELQQHDIQAHSLDQILTEQPGTDNVVLSVRDDLQKVAQQALGGRPGAIIAIDPRTGAILAMDGNPTFDPNQFSSHSAAEVKQAYNQDYTTYANNHNAQGAPLTNQVTAALYAPGSTMKVITTAAIYDRDPSLVNMVWPTESQTKLPQSNLLLHNFGNEVCGGDLIHILTVSCDTAYALAGVAIGASNLAAEAKAFGFGQTPPVDLALDGGTDAVPSVFPPLDQLESGGVSNALTGYSAIGQYNVAQSALGNVLVAAAIADGGTMMTPHVMAHVVDQTGRIVSSYQPHPWLQATSSQTASQVRTDMVSVAASGTARGLFPTADDIAAKTGTAETNGACSANWLIATGPAGPNDTPRVAVAAVIPSSGSNCGSESTGATVAGPAVATLMVAALAVTK
ncbi:MAG TPA: penicillin-binding transpeptidase domain-containing protein [Acidimicrobiales bacterium]|nr:penicillin-binding transpeptidase domain-containing protein [Acidimicrobiales bacterium]